MTFAEMDAMILLNAGSDSRATPVLRGLYLNNAAKELGLPFFFDELETVSTTLVSVSGTASYAVPGGATAPYDIDGIYDLTTGWPLEEKDWAWYSQQFVDPLVNIGIPETWTMHEGRIYLWPIPNAVLSYRVSGRRLPVDMTTLVDSELPVDWHLIVVLMASADLMVSFGNIVRAMELRNEGLAKINSRQEKRTLRRIRGSGQMQAGMRKPRGGGY